MSRLFVSALVLCFILVSCSGGGSDSPEIQVAQLSFTVTSSVSTAEANGQDVSYTLDVSSFNASQLRYSLAGGADLNDFIIDAISGDLSFAVLPDFENPADANSDNTYEIIIEAGDQSSFARLMLSVTITNSIENYQVTRVGTGFVEPLFVTGFVDGTNRLYVLEKRGEIEILDLDQGITLSRKFLNVRNEIAINSERGLLGFALDPDFLNNRTFYIHVNNLNGDTEIRRYQTDAGDLDVADPATMDIILQIPQPAGNHNGGSIEFGNDGFLYIALGDGGGGGDPFANGQDPGTLLGTILRIDVSGDDFPSDSNRDYRIPVGNPFVSEGGAPEIFAYGLRNPYRSAFDRETGLFYIADVGQNEHEEINVMNPETDAGANYGWNQREGVAAFNGGADDPSFTGPVADYTHSSGFGFSVTGGYVYRGGTDLLQDKYIFGDFATARIWALPVDQLDPATPILQDGFEELTADFTPDFGEINLISSFGLDADNNLYIVDFSDGEIFQVTVQ